MKNKTHSVSLKMVRDYFAIQSLSEKFLIFDNYTDDIENLSQLAVTGYPIKFDFDNILVVVCLEGYVKMVVGFDEFLITADHALVIMEGKPFEVKDMSHDFKADIICLKEELFELQGDHTHQIVRMLNENPCQYIPADKKDEIRFIFDNIKQKVKDTGNMFRQQIIQYYLYILTCTICDLLLTAQVPTSLSRNETIFQAFIRNVERHFRQQRNLSFYAEKQNITPKHLSLVIHQLTGKHATEWIDNYTILEAKALLKSSTMSIQEISYELNFSTQSHFGRYFRHHAGMTPKEYRNL